MAHQQVMCVVDVQTTRLGRGITDLRVMRLIEAYS